MESVGFASGVTNDMPVTADEGTAECETDPIREKAIRTKRDLKGFITESFGLKIKLNIKQFIAYLKRKFAQKTVIIEFQYYFLSCLSSFRHKITFEVSSNQNAARTRFFTWLS